LVSCNFFSLSKRYAYKHGYEINPSTELIDLGVANLVGGMFQAFPVTGAVAQSAINDEMGAQMTMASVVTVLIVTFVLLLLTLVFEKLPLNALAAIVISYILGMFVSIFYCGVITLYEVLLLIVCLLKIFTGL